MVRVTLDTLVIVFSPLRAENLTSFLYIGGEKQSLSSPQSPGRQNHG